MYISAQVEAQVLADFETENTSLSLATQTGDNASIVSNPDLNGNSSSKVAYYRKASGNWRAILINFSTNKNTAQNDELTFKIRSSTQGRVFVKIIKQGVTILEGWAPDYATQPVANQWAICKLNIATIKNTDFDRIEVNGSVDNTAAADVYLDDFKLSNSLSPNGEPIIGLTLSTYEIEAGESIFFDASSSFDTDGSIQSFLWSFGNGTNSSGDQVEHIFVEDGIYEVTLSITDNEGKRSSKRIKVNVYPSANKIGKITFLKTQLSTFEKAEAMFLVKGDYANVYDPEIVQVDAIITQPNQQEITVPCFYFQQAGFRPDQWYRTEEEGHWRLRFSAALAGEHQIKIKVKDAIGTTVSIPIPVTIAQGSAKGYIRMDEANRQYYRHTTDEPFYPLGINVAWNTTSNYATIFKNLAEGGANLVRYWQVPFDRQGLEWENGNGFYKGLGVYAQQAAAEQDSIFALCEYYNVYLQPVLFQHGMFSETVNSNWSDNPYNSANGGMLTKAEQFFYNAEAKVYTKKLLRYIVARWGYSRHLFAWELFNEVNFTGQHPNQSSAWYPGVLAWHNEMGQHIKSLDVFDHIVSTSSDDSHLEAMDKLAGLDNVQYHLYNTDLLKTQLTKDKELLAKLTRTGLINGEYGLDVNTADVPFDDQRISIWTGIFSQVPRLMWKWENYVNTNWSDLFTEPADYLDDKDFAAEGSINQLELSAKLFTLSLGAVGFKTDIANYIFVYDKAQRNAISTATVDLSSLEPGNYTLTYTNILTGEEQTETVDLVNEKEFMLPVFSKGIAFRAELNYTIVVGLDSPAQENVFSFYPNPSSDQIFIDANMMKGECVLSLVNTTGIVAGKINLQNSDYTSVDKVSISLKKLNLTPGVYHLQLQTEDGVFNARLIYQ
ncbi:MAG: PKD domain-containing protein [Cytophagia bacterium]|nr:PKD domain-containing protein [Cytophagia bacterium]